MGVKAAAGGIRMGYMESCNSRQLGHEKGDGIPKAFRRQN